MNRQSGRGVWAVVMIIVGAAIAFTASVHAQNLTGAQVAINVSSNAQPMAARAWTIVVPRGTGGVSNQTASIHITLTKKP